MKTTKILLMLSGISVFVHNDVAFAMNRRPALEEPKTTLITSSRAQTTRPSPVESPFSPDRFPSRPSIPRHVPVHSVPRTVDDFDDVSAPRRHFENMFNRPPTPHRPSFQRPFDAFPFPEPLPSRIDLTATFEALLASALRESLDPSHISNFDLRNEERRESATPAPRPRPADVLPKPPTRTPRAEPPVVSSLPIQPTDLQSIEDGLRDRGIRSPETIISSYAAALASQKPQLDFFGFDPRHASSNTAFKEALASLESKGYGSNALLNDWIHQKNKAVKMAGFLNSFGTTLALADKDAVGSTLRPLEMVNQKGLLNKAYDDMTRLITGQVIGIDENRKATREEEQVLIQAAINLGHRKVIDIKKALEIEDLPNDPGVSEMIIEAFLEDYNLRNPRSLNKTTLRHNSILLSISVSAALGIDSRGKNRQVQSVLRSKGFNEGVLQEVDDYFDYAYRTFSFLQPSRHIEAILSERFEAYENAPAKGPTVTELADTALAGIETLGIEKEFIYETLSPYGDQAFQALRNPRRFIEDIRRESENYPLSDGRRGNLAQVLGAIEQALLYPANIHHMNGFSFGSVNREGRNEIDRINHERLTKQTWLNSCYDFIGIYLFAKDSDSLEEFYADATPPEDSPCLPGKVRTTQEWFESKTMKVGDTASVLEKVFAGMAGIELSSAVQQIYRKYVWANLEIYRAEQGGIEAEEAKQHRDFKKEYLNPRAVKEGITDIVKDNLPSVIRKYRSNRSSQFPIEAFHSHKYGHAQLRDGLGDNDYGITNQQDILKRQAQANRDLLRSIDHVTDMLINQGTIEIYRPSGLMSF